MGKINSRREFLKTMLGGAATALLPAGTLLRAALANKKPLNFVFFLVDDFGWTDIGANNPHCFYDTPNIDRLARSGMNFTSGYAANPVCSPTRYSIMTGKYPSRVDATNWFSGKRSARFNPAPLNDKMSLEEVTSAPRRNIGLKIRVLTSTSEAGPSVHLAAAISPPSRIPGWAITRKAHTCLRY
jgi:hypothetical protein